MIRLRIQALSFVATNLALIGTAAAAPNEQTAAGQAIAVEVCSPCHTIGANPGVTSNVPTSVRPGPPFATVAARQTTTRESLQTFLATTHEASDRPVGMPNPHLTREQIRQVSAYILSLRSNE